MMSSSDLNEESEKQTAITSSGNGNSDKSAVPNVKQWFDSGGADAIYKPNLSSIEGNGNPILARGAFGEISIAIRAEKNRWHLVAVKTILQSTNAATAASNPWSSNLTSFNNNNKPKLAHEVFHEICALRLLNPHPNIVELLAVYPADCNRGQQQPIQQQMDLMSGKSVSLAFSYCPTDLYLTLEWRRRSLMPPLPFEAIKTVARDIFSAIHHCHSHGVLHLDIKPGNFLVSSKGFIQLCDFGLAKPFSKDAKQRQEEESRGMCTLYYRPPELLLGGTADDPAVDNYSAGLVLAELLNGLPLFQGGNALGQLAAIFGVLGTPNQTNWPRVSELPDYGKLNYAPKTKKPFELLLPRATESPFLLDLFQQLIVLDPQRRLSAERVLCHRWLDALPKPASREILQEELIPSHIREMILLSNPNMDLTVASKQAIDQAKTRRGFLSSLHQWRGNQQAKASSGTALHDRCSQLCPALY